MLAVGSIYMIAAGLAGYFGRAWLSIVTNISDNVLIVKKRERIHEHVIEDDES